MGTSLVLEDRSGKSQGYPPFLSLGRSAKTLQRNEIRTLLEAVGNPIGVDARSLSPGSIDAHLWADGLLIRTR